MSALGTIGASPVADHANQPADATSQHHPRSLLSRNEVLCLFPGLASLATVREAERPGAIIGAIRILDWLATFPGDTWQERWLAADAEQSPDWIDNVTAGEPVTLATRQQWARRGLYWIFLTRAIQPGYGFFHNIRSQRLFDYTRASLRPDLFATLQRAGGGAGLTERSLFDALNVIAKMVLHTGRDIDELIDRDAYERRARCVGSAVSNRRVHHSVDLAGCSA
jgi:hypothetical protein